jgi:ribosome-binding factor A
VRLATIALLVAGLVACNRANRSNEAIRQGVLDHLAGRDLNVASMNIEVTSVQFNGDKADATVVFSPKGATAAQGMTLRYQMEQKSGRWQVVGTQDSGHAAIPPGAANPHGGAVPNAPSPHGAMPSPEDLPPAGKK